MADTPVTSIDVADGLASDVVIKLSQCLEALSERPPVGLEQPVISPAVLLGHPELAGFAASMMASEGMSMVHESQSFSRESPIPTDAALKISARVQVRNTSTLFDVSMSDPAGRKLGDMQTRLREVSATEMAGFKGSAFPPHMDKGDVVWSQSLPFTRAAVQDYLALANDPNPIHVDDDRAIAAGLPGAVVPGMHFAGVAEIMLAQALSDVVLVSMKLRFMAPVLVGQSLSYGVLVRKKDAQGCANVVRVFILRPDNVIAAIADLEMKPA